MPVQRVLAFIAGKYQEYVARDTSAGAADAGHLVALNTVGRIDSTMFPAGFGSSTATLPATESLAAGAYVNVYNASGTPSVRNADGSTSGKPAHGFVLAAVASGANALVNFDGINTAVTGAVTGDVFLGTTAGVGAAAGASTAGQTYQQIGVALSPTSVQFEPQIAVIRA